VERYWTLAYTPKQTLSFPEAVERTRELLREAVRLRLVSDVPLGAFLSGGIDSSAVVALMAEASSEPVKTFTIGFDDQTFTETHYARLIAERYATDHHEFTIRPDAAAMLPDLVWAYGDPFADSSALPTYYVAKLTREHVTVALNGDGGDEAFAGYDRYLAGRLATLYEHVPRWLREGIVRPAVNRLPESTDRKDLARRVRRFTSAMSESPERRYARWITLLDNEAKQRLYSPAFRAEMAGVDSVVLLEDAFGQADSADLLDRTQFADVQTYLPDDLLVKADIATSMVSLEGRSPFLDHVLAEFAATLPAGYKLRGTRAKHVLKEAMRAYLPPEILNRDKQGFGMPVGAWFRGSLRDLAYRVLLDPVTLGRGLLDGEAVRALLDEHMEGRVNHGYRIWQLLCLELWYRTYVDRTALDGPAGGIF
jgi:asparagine synthase (glutamine-hydrolysing)